jgi:hypothetical protein
MRKEGDEVRQSAWAMDKGAWWWKFTRQLLTCTPAKNLVIRTKKSATIEN